MTRPHGTPPGDEPFDAELAAAGLARRLREERARYPAHSVTTKGFVHVRFSDDDEPTATS